MTTEYRFTSKSTELGSNLVYELNKFIKLKNKECKDHFNSANIMNSLVTLEVRVEQIHEYQNNKDNLSLNTILNRDYLTFTEALLLAYGLYPPSHCFNLKQEPELDARGNNISGIDHILLLNYFKDNSEVYAMLSNAITAGKDSNKHGIQSDSKDGVYTEQFLPWAIDKGFIENTNDKPDTGNIGIYHNHGRSLIADHNKKVALEEYENWVPTTGGSKNPNAFVNDSTTWAKLESKLKSLLKEDVNGNQLAPSKNTISQYIRDDINSKKT